MPMVQARDSNSTTFVYNISDKMSFVEIHNQKLFVDSHHQQAILTHPEDKLKDITTYQKKYYYTMLFNTGPQVIGEQFFETIRLLCHTKSDIYKGKNPVNDSIVFGIPLKYNDMINHEVSVANIKPTFPSQNYSESFAR